MSEVNSGCDMKWPDAPVSMPESRDHSEQTGDYQGARFDLLAAWSVESVLPRREESLVIDLQDVIKALLPAGYPSVQQAARRLDLSVRTLQRRLQESGCTYSGLVERVRYEEACRLLRHSDHSVADIATRLAYNDASHFSRAFRRWEHSSPRSYRQSVRCSDVSLGDAARNR
jgi:AraC-like DNA-binding protein